MILKEVFRSILLLSWVKWAFLAIKYYYSGKNIYLGVRASLYNCKLGRNIKLNERVRLNNCAIGSNTYIGKNTTINNATIGKFCSISMDVKAGLGFHPTDFISTSPYFYSERQQLPIMLNSTSFFKEYQPIEIGNDVWIGANVIIFDGVKIGDGAIIGAGAVVNRNVDPYTIVGGVPIKNIRRRFDDSIVELLLEKKWWEKSNEWLNSNKDFFKKKIASKDDLNQLFNS